MANRTIAEQIAALEARRDKLEAALDQTESGISSFAVDGMSTTYSSPRSLRDELTRVEKSLQRLYRGGRGIIIDMSTRCGTGGTL